ncbi:cytidylyltransferase domain-containing protein [Oceanimonas sp. GK1]|uniref:acylneuraminate cytidylyltransferase family protein n=1 Tax=Oceanimonas sp. (strain GK1 / IBRC-M 10197) TaxID=511062 RepID=UPI0005A148FC|nr:acylneuraminate cytidylyltransferase family protein [Oceanimonas sp. GK1]
MNIAIIPARGGSKRLPNKNIKLMAGKPMICWTIEAALTCNIFDHIFVSTDSEEIAKIAIESGAVVPFLRPASLSSDEASTYDVVSHLIDWFESEHEEKVNTITILQPTSPLRTAEDIKNVFGIINNHTANAVISICPLEYPLEFCNTLNKGNTMKDFIKPENIKRSQLVRPAYRVNGAIYLMKREMINNGKNIYSESTLPYIMSAKSSVDIDTLDDFEYAEYLMKKSLGTLYK